MKKISLLMSVLALAACAGGSGGGSGGAPIMPGAPVIPNDNSIAAEIRAANLEITSMVDNETQRTVYLQSALGDDYDEWVQELDSRSQPAKIRKNTLVRASDTPGESGNTPAPLTCRSNGTCNQLVLDEMYRILISEIDNWENVDEKDIIRVLRAAGYKHEVATHNDDIKAWFRDNKDKIKQHTQDVFDVMGQSQNLDLSKAVFDSDMGEFRLILTDGEITGFKFDMGDDVKLTAVRDASQNKFTVNEKLYEYSLWHVGDEFNKEIAASEKGCQLSFMSNDVLTIDQVKEKLLAELENAIEEGRFFPIFGYDKSKQTEEEIEQFIQDVRDSATAQINALTDIDQIVIGDETDGLKNISLESYGKEIGLAYSDFGFIKVVGDDGHGGEEIERNPFYGGYEEFIKEDKSKFDNKMVFVGQTAGLVTYNDGPLNNDNKDDSGTKQIAGIAQLDFVNGTETLNAKFDGWYDVEIIKTGQEDASIEFTNGNKINKADENFKFFDVVSDTQLVFEDEHSNDDMMHNNMLKSKYSGVSGNSDGDISINYFGTKDSMPSEVSGSASYHISLPYWSSEEKKTEGSTDRGRNLMVDFGFGAINSFKSHD